MFCSADPTDGFTEVKLTNANFELQKPYDMPLEGRYSFVDGLRKMWFYADDKPHVPSSHTQPCIKVQIKGLDYSSGVWQFEGHCFVPNGTSGAMVAPIHGAAHGATALILRIYNGDSRLNIIHDVDGGKVTVFLDRNQVFQVADKGPGDLHFKCGVHGAPANISYYMESRWRDIKIYMK
ncbi:hypothetical protein EUGRSUZ_F04233 [Eucalyptus grandis]|uniref:Uncharacterized protein n=2 Tax=Eucalyptus grandis TaxID=71139 RepID=A0ACC3KPX9_EUCGR|nr:hypothetical protein EUGRSUZ_F04233 [Eucalyptus grandis]